jgi:hypothetical protein
MKPHFYPGLLPSGLSTKEVLLKDTNRLMFAFAELLSAKLQGQDSSREVKIVKIEGRSYLSVGHLKRIVGADYIDELCNFLPAIFVNAIKGLLKYDMNVSRSHICSLKSFETILTSWIKSPNNEHPFLEELRNRMTTVRNLKPKKLSGEIMLDEAPPTLEPKMAAKPEEPMVSKPVQKLVAGGRTDLARFRKS